MMPTSVAAQGPLDTDSQRLLAIGGLLLVSLGMLFGDVFAMFILHPNNARIGEAMYRASQLIPTGDTDGILTQFKAIGGFLENKGTKVDTHSHIIHMGYIALLLAIIQPWVNLPPTLKRRTAWLFILSATFLPISIFSIYYVGIAYSPLEYIGWGSILADLFGALLALAVAIQFWGLWRNTRNPEQRNIVPPEQHTTSGNTASRTLLAGGFLLLVCGFLYGAGYSAWSQSGAAVSEVDILKNIISHAASASHDLVAADFDDYGNYQMYRAINIAVHTHINEMAILLLLMSFIQGYIQYSEQTRNKWAKLAVISGFGLPTGILLEIKFGIVGSIVADFLGFTMIVALVAMVFGLLRYTGSADARNGGSS